MRQRVLSLALAGIVILATAASAFAQVAVITPTSGSRVDLIAGFAQTSGVPAVASGTFQPQVKATDSISATMGTILAPYIQDLDAYFATLFGWRASAPVTVVLYSDSSSMMGGITAFTGGTLAPELQSQAAGQPAALIFATQGQGLVPDNSWVIAVNTDTDLASQQFINLAGQVTLTNASLVPSGTTTSASTSLPPLVVQNSINNGMAMIQESIANQYANLMITDLAGSNGPSWFRQGLANAISFSIVPGFPTESGWAEAVSRTLNVTNTLPTLTQLDTGGYQSMLSTGGSSAAVAQGIGFMSSRSLMDTLGGIQTATFLSELGLGVSFDSALTSFGENLSLLNTQYQSLIP